MREVELFVSAFIIVCALVIQQRNIHLRRYFPATANAGIIAALNLIAVRMGADASPSEMAAYIMGQALGTVLTMWAQNLWLSREAEPSD